MLLNLVQGFHGLTEWQWEKKHCAFAGLEGIVCGYFPSVSAQPYNTVNHEIHACIKSVRIRASHPGTHELNRTGFVNLLLNYVMGRSLRMRIKIAEEFETVDHEFVAIFFEGGGAADCEGHRNRGEMYSRG